jgi:hypothetical protein
MIAAPVLSFTETVHAQNAEPVPIQPEHRDYFREPLPAARNAFELTLGMGYTQGFGSLQQSIGMPSVAGAGIAFNLAGAYRVTPHWAAVVGMQYQELTPERANAARGLTGGFGADYHILPYVKMDPYIRLESGYRFLWERNVVLNQDVMSHGFQIAKLSVGMDFRASPDVAVSPLVGVDANMFFWQQNPDHAISNPRLNTFIFAGAQGRFDFGGTRERSPRQISARQ